MCSAALSFVGLKRIVYAVLAEDANIEEMIVYNLTLRKINQQLVRGPCTLCQACDARRAKTCYAG